MRNTPPSMHEWRKLFDLAIELKKLAPWEWMTDEEIFGVENPETGEIGYCCVMGALGEHLALGVYLGTKGLAGYQFIRDHSDKYDSEELMHLQKCIMMSFEDRDYLSSKERELIRKLGYRFRGKQAWPKFQRFDPGFYPWYLEKSDVRFLAVAIEQTMVVGKMLMDNPELLDPPEPGLYLVRRQTKKGNKVSWESVWLPPQPVEQPPKELDDSVRQKIAAIKRKKLDAFGFIEYDYFYLPMPVQESPKNRPYFPVAHLFVDSETGLIIHSQIEKHLPTPKDLADIFLTWLDNEPELPQMVLVHRAWIAEYLEPVTRQLGIQLIYTELLSKMTEARNNMFEFWRNNF